MEQNSRPRIFWYYLSILYTTFLQYSLFLSNYLARSPFFFHIASAVPDKVVFNLYAIPYLQHYYLLVSVC